MKEVSRNLRGDMSTIVSIQMQNVIAYLMGGTLNRKGMNGVHGHVWSPLSRSIKSLWKVTPLPHPRNNPRSPSSNNPHTSLIYIDRNHDVRGVRSFFGTEMSSDEMKKGSRIPIVIKEISKMVLQLGMVTQDEFNILKLCDGNNSIETIAEIENKAEIENIILKLKKKKLINIITRG